MVERIEAVATVVVMVAVVVLVGSPVAEMEGVAADRIVGIELADMA